MAKGKEGTSTAIVAPDADKAALAAALDFDYGADDGLQEIDREDMRAPVIIWNQKKKDENGQERRVNQFYDVLNAKVIDGPISCVLIHLHKSRVFKQYDDVAQSNKVVCSSPDMLPSSTGKLRGKHPSLGLVDGTQRDCDGCPDKEWFTDDKGKKKRNCDPVYGVSLAMLNDDGSIGEAFIARFQRTSLPAFKKHLQQHHIGKHPTKRGANVPLFAFSLKFGLETAENGNYATPVFERGPTLPKATIQALAEQAKQLSEFAADLAVAADRQEARADGDDGAIDGGGTRASDFADD